MSFSADAYLNEMGITSPLLPEEHTSSGVYVGWGTEYDAVKDPEDDGTDVRAFADFMRSTKAPSRGEITADVLAGETVFNQVGCAIERHRGQAARVTSAYEASTDSDKKMLEAFLDSL